MSDLWIGFQSISPLFTMMTAVIGGSWALHEFRLRRIADRKKLAAEIFAHFKNHPKTVLATRMLDWIRPIDLGMDDGGKPLRPIVTNELLISALKTLDQQANFEPEEVRIRDIFDSFLTELDMMAGYVQSGLLKEEDIKPFIGYWIDILNGEGPLHRPDVIAQVNNFIRAFGFHGVQALQKKFKRGTFHAVLEKT